MKIKIRKEEVMSIAKKLGGFLLVGTAAAICNYYNIQTGPVYKLSRSNVISKPNYFDILDIRHYTETSKESAISALYSNACSATWSSDKVKIASQIRDLAKGSDEQTKQYGISILSKIAELCDWSSDRRRISDYILEVANS